MPHQGDIFEEGHWDFHKPEEQKNVEALGRLDGAIYLWILGGGRNYTHFWEQIENHSDNDHKDHVEDGI